MEEDTFLELPNGAFINMAWVSGTMPEGDDKIAVWFGSSQTAVIYGPEETSAILEYLDRHSFRTGMR